MSQRIFIKAGNITVEGDLNDSPVAKLILEKLPIESSGNLWGDEIYFSIPVSIESDENLTDKVQLGDIGYWPIGKAFCIFFGPTPLSENDGEIVPAGEVNIIGKLSDDPKKLKDFKDGDFVVVSQKKND